MADFFELVRNGEILTHRVTRASTFLERLVGLLGKKGVAADEALLLAPCRSIHTFFMKFPIDIVFLTRKGRVIALIPHLKPNRLTRIYFSAAQALECAAGTIERWRLKKNQILELRSALRRSAVRRSHHV